MIDQIEKRTSIAIVSPLVIAETIHSLRQRISQKTPFEGESIEKRKGIEQEIRHEVHEFMKRINQFSKDKKIIIPQPEIKLKEYHHRLLQKTQNYFGYVRVMSNCPYCKNGKVSKESTNKCESCGKEHQSIQQYQYKGLGHADLEHAFLAKDAQVTELHSSDRSFQDLKKDSDFGDINFIFIPNPVNGK